MILNNSAAERQHPTMRESPAMPDVERLLFDVFPRGQKQFRIH